MSAEPSYLSHRTTILLEIIAYIRSIADALGRSPAPAMQIRSATATATTAPAPAITPTLQVTEEDRREWGEIISVAARSSFSDCQSRLRDEKIRKVVRPGSQPEHKAQPILPSYVAEAISSGSVTACQFAKEAGVFGSSEGRGHKDSK